MKLRKYILCNGKNKIGFVVPMESLRNTLNFVFKSINRKNLKNIVKKGVGNLKTLISMDLEEHNEGIYSEKELIKQGKELIDAGNKEYINAEINNEEMSIMLFTSGTISASKVVALSHKNIASNLMDIASILDVNENDVFLSFLPLHHVFECTVGFLFSLYKGAMTAFSDGMRYIIENLNEYKVTVMASVPAIYERTMKIILRELENKGELEQILENEEKYKDSTMEEKKKIFKDIHNMLGGNIRLFISGAASLEKSIEQRYRNFGINLVQGYGLTETSPVIAMGNKKYHRVGSVGKAVPSVEAKIVEPNDEGVGELLVKGPNIMLEYFEAKDATKKAFVDDWFCTGDLSKIDEDGYIFICGRKKSVIVLKNGKNIYPEEMENLINRIEGIDESFIFGKQLSEDKENIKIFVKVVYDEDVVKNAYKVETLDEIKNALSGKIKEVNKIMPGYKGIRGIIFTKEPLIKTTTGKIKREKNLEKILKEEIENAGSAD